MLDSMTDLEVAGLTVLAAGVVVLAVLLCRWLRSSHSEPIALPAAPEEEAGQRSQAVRLLGGPGEMPVVQVKQLDPLAALEARDKLAQKQGGQHLVEADRAYTEPDVAWALVQWHYQERRKARKVGDRW